MLQPQVIHTMMEEPVYLPLPIVNLSVNALIDAETNEVLEFLSERPIQTVVMTGMIRDNGIVSQLNRGIFFGCRSSEGKLEGVALIGHSTLVEVRSDKALEALALAARSAETPIHLIWSSGNSAEDF